MAATVRMFTETDVGIITRANIAFSATIDGLEAFGELEPYHAKQIKDTYAIIVSERGWFGRAIDRLLGENFKEGHMIYRLVKVNPTPSKESTT